MGICDNICLNTDILLQTIENNKKIIQTASKQNPLFSYKNCIIQIIGQFVLMPIRIFTINN